MKEYCEIAGRPRIAPDIDLKPAARNTGNTTWLPAPTRHKRRAPAPGHRTVLSRLCSPYAGVIAPEPAGWRNAIQRPTMYRIWSSPLFWPVFLCLSNESEFFRKLIFAFFF